MSGILHLQQVVTVECGDHPMTTESLYVDAAAIATVCGTGAHGEAGVVLHNGFAYDVVGTIEDIAERWMRLRRDET